VSAAHLQGLLDAAAACCGARDPGTAHRLQVTVFPDDEDLLAALAREGSERIRHEAAGPWQAEALRTLRQRITQLRSTRTRAEVSRGLRAWLSGAPGGHPSPDPVADALVDAILADLDTLLGPDWHGEDSPLLPEAPYAEATLLLGERGRLLLELSLDD
jgi:hypothetical protein